LVVGSNGNTTEKRFEVKMDDLFRNNAPF